MLGVWQKVWPCSRLVQGPLTPQVCDETQVWVKSGLPPRRGVVIPNPMSAPLFFLGKLPKLSGIGRTQACFSGWDSFVMGAMLFLLFLILFCGEMLKKKKSKGFLRSLGSFGGGEQRNWLWDQSVGGCSAGCGGLRADGPTAEFCWGWGLKLTSDRSLNLLPDSHPASRSKELGWSQLRMGIWETWELDSGLPFPWPAFSGLSFRVGTT